jgi:nitroreductase
MYVPTVRQAGSEWELKPGSHFPNISSAAAGLKRALSRRLCDDYDRGVPSAADFLNNPAQLEGVYAERARAVGAATLAVKGIDRGDEAARRAHIRENFDFFNAPVEMIFHLPGDAVPGSFLALGCFLQNVMLGLTAAGLGSCPQYSVAGYGATIREHLGLPDEQIVVCGLAVGWVDPAAPINTLVPERAPLAEYVSRFE